MILILKYKVKNNVTAVESIKTLSYHNIVRFTSNNKRIREIDIWDFVFIIQGTEYATHTGRGGVLWVFSWPRVHGAPARGGIKSNPLSCPLASVNSKSPKYQTGVGE